jgi:hypothetical protein
MGRPPSEGPSYHEKKMLIALEAISWTRFIGASGARVIIAPLPAGELWETPMIFVAVTFANTLEPQTRLKGASCKVANGIVHIKAEMTAALAPLQDSRSCE